MRIAAFFAIVLLFVVGVTTTRVTSPATAAEDPTPTAAKDCSTVFVGGKGQVDSCSGERKDTSRLYPRRAGIPAQGCAEVCPEPPAETAKATGTPGPSDTSKPQGTVRDFATPVPSDFTTPGAPSEAPKNCDRVSYPDICVPAAPPYLSCSDIPDRNFRVRAPDPHRFDADGNGIGCEEVRGPTIGR